MYRSWVRAIPSASAKSYPVLDTEVLPPDAPCLDSASCPSYVSCTQMPHLVGPGASGDSS